MNRGVAAGEFSALAEGALFLDDAVDDRPGALVKVVMPPYDDIDLIVDE